MPMSAEKRVLLIVSGNAASQSLELIRHLRERGIAVRCVLTERFTIRHAAFALGAERG